MNVRVWEGKANQAPGASSGSGGRPSRPGMTRRSFLRNAGGAVGGMAAVVAALSPLKDLPDDAAPSLEQFLQKHYKEMSPEELEGVMARIRREVEERFGVAPDLKDYKPIGGVQFGYALNLSRCIGCRKCVHACVEENNLSRSPEIQYIRVLEMPRGTIDLERGNHA